MKRIDTYKSLYFEDIARDYLNLEDTLMTTDTRASDSDIIRMAYMHQGARLLFDKIIERLIKEDDDK